MSLALQCLDPRACWKESADGVFKAFEGSSKLKQITGLAKSSTNSIIDYIDWVCMLAAWE